MFGLGKLGNFLKHNYAIYKKSAKNLQFIQSISEPYQSFSGPIK